MKRRTGDSSWGSQLIGNPSRISSAKGNSLLLWSQGESAEKKVESCLRGAEVVVCSVPTCPLILRASCLPVVTPAWLLQPCHQTAPSLPRVRDASCPRDTLQSMNSRSVEGFAKWRVLGVQERTGELYLVPALAGLSKPHWAARVADGVSHAHCFTVGVLHQLVSWSLYCSDTTVLGRRPLLW